MTLPLPVKKALLDGEVVLLDETGRTSFQLLQNAFKSSSPAPFLFYVFDLLAWMITSLSMHPLSERDPKRPSSNVV